MDDTSIDADLPTDAEPLIDASTCLMQQACDEPRLLLHFDNDPGCGESAGIVFDHSGNGNNASCGGSNCPTWTSADGRFGGGYAFDGMDDFLQDITLPSLASAEGTWMIWAKLDNLDGDPDFQSIMTKEVTSCDCEDFSLYFDGVDDRFSLRAQSASFAAVILQGGPTVVADRWYHLAFTYGPAGLFLYVDGALVDSDLNYQAGLIANAPLVFGGGYGGVGRFESSLTGLLDDVAVFGYALTGTAIQSRFSTGQALGCDAP